MRRIKNAIKNIKRSFFLMFPIIPPVEEILAEKIAEIFFANGLGSPEG